MARFWASAESAAAAAPRLIRGIAIAAMIPMITTTITNSIMLNPPRRRPALVATRVACDMGLAPAFWFTL
jgi:hypothetical protein